MDQRFQKEMEQLKVKVLQMAAYTDRALERALAAIANRDAELARQVIDSDRDINAMECEVDNLSLRLLALDQPVAMDLRFIVSSMRMVVDLERIGDEAVNIAEQAVLLAQLPAMSNLPDLNSLGSQVTDMYRLGVRSFRDQDPELARQVCAADSVADDLNMKVLKECMDAGAGEGGLNGLDRAIRTVIVARSMERIGDLSTNIAEACIFVVKGVSVKHHCQPF
ncbi:phosphate signaling complex protein PhoU [Fundidesulfovibrio agrisoli]|uniref:phosphate signaling complex protein PhoU n=1 Tax=Fundidesulfovibrio agrisoli TaxID=2922717 RepID=UPI001FACD890|nr:phosphate signaling complex protein PhoU [Fundidesulfovibrio agrisoli]